MATYFDLWNLSQSTPPSAINGQLTEHGVRELKQSSENGQKPLSRAAQKCLAAHGKEVTSDGGPSTEGQDDFRIVANDPDLASVTKRTWNAIELANAPEQLFFFNGQPIRLENDDEGQKVTNQLDANRLTYELSERLNFVIETLEGDLPSSPPKKLVLNILAMPNPPLPILRRLVRSPIFSSDGKLQTVPGYHPSNRTFYAPASGFSVPNVSSEPTSAEVTEARALIEYELLGDFPFLVQNDIGSDRANAIALLLLPFARDLINGPTPLHLIEKPSPGTGATLLIDVMALLALGKRIETTTEARDEDEWRKRITANLMTSPSHFFIDNLGRRLDSQALASAITSPLWCDRLLGRSEVIRAHVACCWVASGNNPSVSSEIARRSIRIRMDSSVDRPWLRGGFRHENLYDWALENRPKLVWAALTLIQSWVVAGRPLATKKLGMFESWAMVMGGILANCGIIGFLDNLSEFYDQADAESAAWKEFIGEWWQRFSTTEASVKELWKFASEGTALNLGDGSEQSQKIRLGKMLSQMRDRQFLIPVFNELGNEDAIRIQIVRGAQHQRSYGWRLYVSDSAEKSPSECGECSDAFPSPIHPGKNRKLKMNSFSFSINDSKTHKGETYSLTHHTHSDPHEKVEEGEA